MRLAHMMHASSDSRRAEATTIRSDGGDQIRRGSGSALDLTWLRLWVEGVIAATEVHRPGLQALHLQLQLR